MLGRWLKPSKNASAYSSREPAWLQRTPTWERSGNVASSSVIGHWRTRRRDNPALVDQRRAAGREPVPHPLDRVHAEPDARPDAGHRQELVVDDVQEIARREPVRRRDDVGLAPAHELLAGVQREPAAADRRAETPDRQRRPQQPAVGEIHAPARIDLVVGVGADVAAGRELNPRRRLDEHFFAHQQVAGDVDRVVGRVLREIHAGAVDETALRDGLRGDRLRRTAISRATSRRFTGGGSPAA